MAHEFERVGTWQQNLAHWLAGGWIVLGRRTRHPRGPGEFIYRHLYWCITTLTTVGYGNVTPVTAAQMDYSMVHHGLGHTDETFRYLDEAVDKGIGSVVFLAKNLWVESLRSGPRFDALLKRVGHPSMWSPEATQLD